MQKQQIPLKNSLFLLLAAIIWGIAFVAQSVGMEYVGGFTFSAVRSLLGVSCTDSTYSHFRRRKNSASDTAATKQLTVSLAHPSGTVSSMPETKRL